MGSWPHWQTAGNVPASCKGCSNCLDVRWLAHIAALEGEGDQQAINVTVSLAGDRLRLWPWAIAGGFASTFEFAHFAVLLIHKQTDPCLALMCFDPGRIQRGKSTLSGAVIIFLAL